MLNLVSKSGNTGRTTLVALLCAAILLVPGFAPASAAASRYDFRAEEITTGETLSMSQLEDKPLIVHIWSPECPHCQRHMPYLVAFYRTEIATPLKTVFRHQSFRMLGGSGLSANARF